MGDRATVIESIRFEAKELEYIEAGRDFREGTRLYDSGVVGDIHSFINETELIFENRLPAAFEVSKTVRSMYQMMRNVTASGHDRTTPFCCSCGVRGCAVMEWKIEETDVGITVQMEGMMENPVGAHTYQTQVGIICEAISELSAKLIATLREAGVEKTTGGTISEFCGWKNELDRWGMSI